jgi:hypothetical protein
MRVVMAERIVQTSEPVKSGIIALASLGSYFVLYGPRLDPAGQLGRRTPRAQPPYSAAISSGLRLGAWAGGFISSRIGSSTRTPRVIQAKMVS